MAYFESSNLEVFRYLCSSQTQSPIWLVSGYLGGRCNQHLPSRDENTVQISRRLAETSFPTQVGYKTDQPKDPSSSSTSFQSHSTSRCDWGWFNLGLIFISRARPDNSGERLIGGKAAKRQCMESKKQATDETARIDAITAFTAVASRRAEASEESNRIASNLMSCELKSTDLEIARAKEDRWDFQKDTTWFKSRSCWEISIVQTSFLFHHLGHRVTYLIHQHKPIYFLIRLNFLFI